MEQKLPHPNRTAQNFDLSRGKGKNAASQYSLPWSSRCKVFYSSRHSGLPSSTRYINNELLSAASCFSERMGNLPAGLILVASPVLRDLELSSHVEDNVAAGSGHTDGLGSQNFEFRSRGVGQPVEWAAGLQRSALWHLWHDNTASRHTFSTGARWAFSSPGVHAGVCAAWSASFSKRRRNALLSIASVTKSQPARVCRWVKVDEPYTYVVLPGRCKFDVLTEYITAKLCNPTSCHAGLRIRIVVLSETFIRKIYYHVILCYFQSN